MVKDPIFFIGIDIGTSSVCGVLYDLVNQAFKSVTKENDANIEASYDFEKTQDPGRILEIVNEIISELSDQHIIKGIGFTGQMHGILYLDNNGDAISPLYTWQDARGNNRYRNNKSYSEYLTDETGYQLSTGYGMVTHYYNLENNLVPVGAVKVCTVMDYAVMNLCKRLSPVTDYSNAASLGFFDKQNLCFDLSSLKQAGIDTTILPEVSPSATLAGYYKGTVPVYSATGDNQASILGSVKDIRKSIQITVGTGSQISVYTDKFTEIKDLEVRPFPGGGYILAGAALCGGKSFDILKTFFEKTLDFFGASSTEKVDFYKKMTMAEYGGMDLPVVETLFEGTRIYPALRGRITNISGSNLTPENLIVAFLNGISTELHDFYELIPESVKENKDIVVCSGNAVRKNILLRKSIEEKFKCPVFIPQHQEEAAFGACICAIAGGGFIKSLFDTGEMIRYI